SPAPPPRKGRSRCRRVCTLCARSVLFCFGSGGGRRRLWCRWCWLGVLVVVVVVAGAIDSRSCPARVSESAATSSQVPCAAVANQVHATYTLTLTTFVPTCKSFPRTFLFSSSHFTHIPPPWYGNVFFLPVQGGALRQRLPVQSTLRIM
ncbi:unnamed protein product, partial [Ectocarpus sp. 13 AM-2016]